MSEEERDIINNAKNRILGLFAELGDSELRSVEQWIGSKKYKKEEMLRNRLRKTNIGLHKEADIRTALQMISESQIIRAVSKSTKIPFTTVRLSEDLENKKSIIRSDKLLHKIGEAIKTMVPFDAEMPSEKIAPPLEGDQADCNEVNTCHVDEFLYDEEEVEELVKEGKLTRHYCLDCNSRNVQELTLISHSMSRQQLQYLFKVLLPKDLEDKQILDVGSRFGGILYSAYYFTNALNIVGIEMNKECCELQENIINQFGMDKNRIKIVHSDVTKNKDILKESDICILNVFDFFVTSEEHKRLWYFFKECLKKGSYVVMNRSIVDTLTGLDIFEEFDDWLSVCRPLQMENEIFFDVEDLHEIYLYTVN